MNCQQCDFHSPISRSPCGERGLKFLASFQRFKALWSLPVRGAWVEIPFVSTGAPSRRRSPCGERGLKFRVIGNAERKIQSLPVRGAWVEIGSPYVYISGSVRSLPVRGAWVEIAAQAAHCPR